MTGPHFYKQSHSLQNVYRPNMVIHVNNIDEKFSLSLSLSLSLSSFAHLKVTQMLERLKEDIQYIDSFLVYLKTTMLKLPSLSLDSFLRNESSVIFPSLSISLYVLLCGANNLLCKPI